MRIAHPAGSAGARHGIFIRITSMVNEKSERSMRSTWKSTIREEVSINVISSKAVSCRIIADCDMCGLCTVFRGKDAEQVYDDYIMGKRPFMDVSEDYKR